MVGEQNAVMWCVGEELVMFHRKPFVSDRLTVSLTGGGGQPPSVDLKIATKGEWPSPRWCGPFSRR